MSGYILDEKQNPLQSAEVVSQHRTVFTDQSGFFVLPYLFDEESIIVRKRDYQEVGFLTSSVGGKTFTLSLVPENQSFLSKIYYWLMNSLKLW